MSKKKQKTTISKKAISNKFEGKISLVIPCYNESKRINSMIKTLKDFAGKWSSPLK